GVAAFLAVCVVGFFASTLFFLLADPPNGWPLYLAGPVLLFIGAYSLTKRFTALAHFWLGASLMLAPIAAWISIRGPVDLAAPVILGLAVLFWVSGFDILYACQDVDIDRRLGLRSVPAALGVPVALRVAAACHALTAALLVALYFVAAPVLGAVYLTGVGAVGLLVGDQHWLGRPE